MSSASSISARAPERVGPRLVDRLAGVVASATLALTLAFGIAVFWIAPRPPMSDLSQHVGQVVLWKDLIVGQSPFADLFRINLLTPYLTGYGTALLLSFVMPPLIAFKVLLSLAFVAFVLSCRQLMRDVGAEQRLALLAVPGFFGFAFDWGLFTFLVCTPIAVQFIRLALHHARSASTLTDVGIVALGIVLLFSHGLLFLFAGFVGGVWLLAHNRSVRAFMRGALPYMALGVICLAYFVASRRLEAPAALGGIYTQTDPVVRIAALFMHVQSSTSAHLVPLTGLLVLGILRLGLQWSSLAAVPFLIVAAIMLFGPVEVYSTDLVYQRFAMFQLPFLAMAFVADRVDTPLRRAWLVAMLLAVWASLAFHAGRTYAFAVENRDFERVLAASEPGRRAATYIKDPTSAAAYNRSLAANMPAWYQADGKGIIDFNFALFHPQVVRYRSDRVPYKGYAFTTSHADFDWSLPQTRVWDYYFIRLDDGVVPPPLIDPACALRLVAQSGRWVLYERMSCPR